MITPIAEQHLDAVLALNNLHAVETSWLDRARLGRMIGTSYAASMVCEGPDLGAFLIAFDESADYDSPNFLWFRARRPRFIYVDRIVTAAASRGRGHARLLYEHLFDRAAAQGGADVVCEVNLVPPNAASDAFHDKMGFVEIGRARLSGAAKTVRYLAATIRAG